AGGALEGVLVEPGAQEGIKSLAAETLLEKLQEPGALVIGHRTQRVLRVAAGAGRQHQYLLRFRHLLHLLDQAAAGIDELHVSPLLALQGLDDAVLDVTGDRKSVV